MKVILCSLIGKSNIVKAFFFAKSYLLFQYSCNQNLYLNNHRNRKTNPKNHMDTQNIQIAQTILSRRANSGRITTLDIKMNCRSIVGKTKWYLHKKQHVRQWNNIKSPNMSTKNFSHLIFDKYSKNISRRKESNFHKWC